jgi:hypothetical protein
VLFAQVNERRVLGKLRVRLERGAIDAGDRNFFDIRRHCAVPGTEGGERVKIPLLLLIASCVGCGLRAIDKGPISAPSMSREELLSAKIRCADQASKYYKQNADRGKDALAIGQRVVYSEKLNTCLYWDGTYSTKGFKAEYIMDLLESAILVEYHASTKASESTPESRRAEDNFIAWRKRFFAEPESRLAGFDSGGKSDPLEIR